MKCQRICIALFFATITFSGFSLLCAQETPPAPGPPPQLRLPEPKEKTLPNGLRVIVVNLKNIPLVTDPNKKYSRESNHELRQSISMLYSYIKPIIYI